MSTNYLLTGSPGSGKTTIIQRVRDSLEARDYRAGGIFCPDLRSDGDRVGFEIVDLATGDARVLAHVDRAEGPQVGTYRVNVAAVDAICSSAFPRAFDRADFLIVDEIAPMEVYSDEFVQQVRRALDSDLPLLAAIHYRSTKGFIGEVKGRDDIELFEVTDDTRDDLTETVTDRLLRSL